MPPDAPSPRLLILDDERMIGETIQRVAEFGGLAARHVCDPQTFFAEVERVSPDIIALDLVMPQMDGVEVIRELARRGCRARIIITSGVGSRVLDAAERSARAHGLDIVGVLPKPFSSPMLRALIEQALLPVAGLQLPAGPAAEPRYIPPEALEAALEGGQIKLVYQPKVHCRTGSLTGFEVLARWQHPVFGAVPPDAFVPLAEQHGLIDRLTEVVSAQALSWLAALGEEPGLSRHARHVLGRTHLSINISALSLDNRALFEAIAVRCDSLRIAPERVVLELTESSAMRDTVTALDNLTRLRLQGFHLSIDDFGTGYSSMVQLVRLPFSEIKVDRSFVSKALASEESRTVVRSVVDLGRSLGLHTTAEGVEDDEALGVLRGLGCDHVQGFWIARPLAPGAVLPWFLARECEREESRVAALQAMGLLDTPPEARFDRITRLARRLFSVPMSMISFIDRDRQWFKSCDGIKVSEVPRGASFCDLTLSHDDAFVVEDASADPLLSDYPQVTAAPFVRFYAGHPLCLPDGEKVGALCLVDRQPRSFSDADRRRLACLAREVERELLLDGEAALEALTGLPDRRTFHLHAEALIGLCRQIGVPAGFVSVRLLDLPMLNQRSGREAGDGVISRLGQCIAQTAGSADLAGRCSGTEFVLMLIDPDPDVVEQLCRRLHSVIEASNAQRPADASAIHCKIATARLHGNTQGTLDDILRASRRTFAAVTGD